MVLCLHVGLSDLKMGGSGVGTVLYQVHSPLFSAQPFAQYMPFYSCEPPGSGWDPPGLLGAAPYGATPTVRSPHDFVQYTTLCLGRVPLFSL